MFRCCASALQSMVDCRNTQVTRVTVAIVSVLVAKIPLQKTTQLGINATYMNFLIGILKNKLIEQTTRVNEDGENPLAGDFTLKFTLSALWNLSGK